MYSHFTLYVFRELEMSLLFCGQNRTLHYFGDLPINGLSGWQYLTV